LGPAFWVQKLNQAVYPALAVLIVRCFDVAVLGSEFREQPRSAEVAVGTDVLLGCRAPRGEPEPRVRWQRNGDPVRPDDRVTVSETGTLRIRDSSKDDSGTYVCVAYNIGGEKESSPARLTVRGSR